MENGLGKVALISCVTAILVACTSPSQPATIGTPSASKAAATSAVPNNNPRAKLVSASTRAIGEISYSSATSDVRGRLGPISKAARGVSGTTQLSTVSVDGSQIGGVASVAVPSGMARNATFQDQFVVQLLNALTKGSRPPRFIRVNGRPVAVTNGPVSMAGWFQGNRAFVVARESRKPDVASLAAAIMTHHPPKL